MKTKYKDEMDHQLKQFTIAYEAKKEKAAADHWDKYVKAKRLHDELCEGE